MFQRLKNLFSNHPEPMNKIFINKQTLLKNFELHQQLHPNKEIFPVVKSNAYGHGLAEVSKIFNKTKTKYLCVDSFPEYQIVKDNSNKKILLIGETPYRNYRYFDTKRTTFCIYNIEAIHYLGKKNKKITIHLFLNTGMNREGVQSNDLLNILETLKKYPKIKVEGVLSHFYDADNMQSQNYQHQIQKFKTMYNIINNYGHSPKYRHISNSAGYFRNDDDFFNSARIGLSLYGYSPFKDQEFKAPPYACSGKISGDGGHPSETREGDKKYKNYKKAQEVLKQLTPALRITSTLISKQHIGKNEGVSYHHSFINASEQTTVGTIPFGYMEGLPKRASGKLIFKHKKTPIRQIGNICMNLSSCLLEKDIACYETIEIASPKGENSITTRAKQADMLIYEVLVKLDKNIRREIE